MERRRNKKREIRKRKIEKNKEGGRKAQKNEGKKKKEQERKGFKKQTTFGQKGKLVIKISFLQETKNLLLMP